MSPKLSIGRAVYIIVLVYRVVIHQGAKLFEVGLCLVFLSVVRFVTLTFMVAALALYIYFINSLLKWLTSALLVFL